jgi:phosphoribosylaminoimidazolecarboxamide formyltransferase/IMP cyclohydrolase
MVDADAAEAMTAKGNFFEGVLAPDFEPAALEILRGRKGWGERVRILAVGPLAPSAPAVPPHGAAGAPSPSSGRAQSAAPPASGAVRSPGDGGASAETEVASQRLGYRSVRGGLLVQAVDSALAREGQWRVATKRAPTPDEVQALRFADVVCKHTKSNAIVFATRDEVVGVGAGQMSRVDSVHMAARKAGDRAKGAVMASDAFFPFPDGVEEAARSGITAVLQPGGSVKDADVVAAADRLGLAMVFTGLRHFLH